MPKQNGMADLIVKGSIALTTVAFFVGAYLQLGMSLVSALIASGVIFAVLAMVHALTRRTEREKDLVGELERLEDEVARLKSDTPSKPEGLPSRLHGPGFAPTPPPMPLGVAKAGAEATDAPPSRIFRKPPPLSSNPQEDMPAEPDLDFAALRPGKESTDEKPARPEPSLSIPLKAAEKTSASPKAAAAPKLPERNAPPPSREPGSLHDYWPGRTTKPTLADVAPPAASAPPAVPPAAAVPPAPPEQHASVERETDLDAVQGMIKRLADEVGVEDGEPTLEGLPPPRQESALRASLNALQATANVMRSGKRKSGAAGAASKGAATPPPIMPQHARIAALAEAVAAGRIDVELAPIVGLADQQVHHYDVVASPRDQRGNKLTTSTRDPQLALAGLLPMLDSARLRQAADVARSIGEEGREASLLTSATAVSLANDGYLDNIADVYRDREGVAGDLVLTFAQADVRTFGGSEWSALTDMRDLGFRFGVEDVTDFDYEFTVLCAAGFAFVKLDAATLLAGLAAPNGAMSAEEVCNNLSELGLTLIVTGIDDEDIRDKVAAAGVPLGQGAIFGAPLPVAGDGIVAADDAAA